MIVLMHSIHTLFTSKVYPYNNNENIFIRIMYTVLLHSLSEGEKGNNELKKV